MRAIAVLLVVLYHAGLPVLTGGFVGVDVFFVISGFLITGHIVTSLERSTFSFADFYSRRVRRILPASLAVLSLTLVIAWLVVPPLQLARISRDAAWTALYAPNLLFAREGTNYLASPQPSLFQHYWSLGIEEQFYLIWPVLLWAVYRLSGRRLRAVAGVAAFVVVASFVGSVGLTEVNQPWAFFLLPTRAWELGVGGLVAFGLAQFSPAFNPRVRTGLGAIGLLVLIVAAVTFDSQTLYPSYWAGIPVLATALILYAGPYEGIVGKLLQNRVALWVGAISYSVYLVHWPLLVLPKAANSWSTSLPLWQTLLLAVLSIPLGWASYKFIETPFRRPPGRGRHKSALREKWLPLVAAVVCGVLVAGISVVGMRSIPDRDLSAGTAAPRFELSTSPAAAPLVGNNLSVPLQGAQSAIAIPSGKGCNLTVFSDVPPANCAYGGNPGAPTVALLGDSHAAQWAPALETLANDGDILLTAHTKSSCPAFPRGIAGAATAAPDCVNWKSDVMQILESDPPQFIFVSSSYGSVTEESVAEYENGMGQLLEALPQGSQVVIIEDTPKFRGDPISCLSGALTDPGSCSAERTGALKQSYRDANERLRAESSVEILDLTDYICTETCQLVQGDVLVFSDFQHLTASFSRAMAPAFSQELERLYSNGA